MTNTSVQAAIHERVDPVLEAIIKGLVETAAYPERQAQPEDALTEALTEALVVALMTPSVQRTGKQPLSQLSAFGAALASALAAALAPALAESLTPAIVQALSNMATSAQKPGQEKTGQEGQGSEQRQEYHQ